MQLLELKNIKTRDGSLYYRMEYTGTAVYEILQKDINIDIFFSIEVNPFGEKTIIVKFLADIDYPLIPLARLLKTHILALYSTGFIGS